MATPLRKVLGDINSAGGTPASGKKGQQYQKLTQLEHVLVRPDTYIGSVERITDTMVVFDEGTGFNTREVSYVPGLFKIFDEIIVNAADNKQRDTSMDTVKVTIDRDSGTISILNNGRGIPIEMHSKEKIWVPELIFGHLLTSSNYDDKKKKTTGGRNGYGAKLANIFSTSFIVETADSKSKKYYKQKFSNNMSTGHGKQKISSNDKGEDWTKITFTPDLAKFGMTELDDDIIALMTRRVYDIAGVTRGVRVWLNGNRIRIKTFKDYVDMVLAQREGSFPIVHETINDRWEVCVTVSTNGFQQCSFVNSIATTKGGTHVNYITDQVVKHLVPLIKKKNKAAPVKNHQIKAHLWVFVNCLIENPTFDSQTKENHTLAASKFGSKAELDSKFMKNVVKTGIIDNILVWAQVKGQEMMSKKSGGAKRTRLTGIPKLDDANEAGGRNSRKCTLILTEGDSAKTLALSGLSIIGRDYYGVFPLKGKPLNVRDASQKQVLDNAEMKSIVEIMGLKYGFQYDDSTLSKLRYGSIMIMADQDQDGSHIKGLIINMIHHFWPSLLKTDGFLVEFITPIVKVSKGKTEKQFYTLPEYNEWSARHGTEKGWKIKYYKGLGTSTPQEAKSYFASMEKHQLAFEYGGPEDDAAIEMAFSKKKIEERKAWLRGFQKGTFLDHDVDKIKYSSFVHKELILFSMADNVRSIPSMVDGFKPGQRKIMFSCFKRKLTNEIKVAQLAGYVAEHSAYHHGEASLTGTIVGMAQTYVGSNNIALLEPVGQFGTRIQGGKDAASPRYIFTRLSNIARTVFHIHDDPLLDFLEDDGQSIEPEYYMPVLPMVLVNGSDGIGTGWSSKVPSYDPRVLCEYLKCKMVGEELPDLVPYFSGFTGDVAKDSSKKDRYTVKGVITKIDDNTLEVTELPVREWTQDYKQFLDGLLTGEEKPGAFESKSKKTQTKEPSIKDYKEYHTDTTVHFRVTLSDAQMAAAEAIGLEKRFKMDTTVAVSNLVLFDQHGRLKKYDNVEEIMDEFYDIRLSYYQKRKDHLTDKLTQEWSRLDNKVKFILEIIEGTLELRNRPKRDLLHNLKAKGYTEFPKKVTESVDSEDDSEDDGPVSSDGYDYLLGMPFWSLTHEKVEKLKSERATKEEELNILLAKSTQDLWREDLDCVEEQLQAVDNQRDANFQTNQKMRAAAGRKKPAKKKKRCDDSEEDDWVPTKAKKKAAPKPKMVRSREQIDEIVPASPGDSAPPSKQAKVSQSKKAPAFMLSDESDDESMSLAARLAATSKSTKPARRTAKVKAKTVMIDSESELEDLEPPNRKQADSEDDWEPTNTQKKKAVESDEDDWAPTKTKKPAARKVTAPKTSKAKKPAKAKPKSKAPEPAQDPFELPSSPQRSAALSDSEEEMDLAARLAASRKLPSEKNQANKKAPAKKAPAKKAPAKKAPAKKAPAKKAPAKKISKNDDDDDFSISDDDDAAEPTPAVGIRPSRRAAANRVKYTFSDDEEVDLLDESDFSP